MDTVYRVVRSTVAYGQIKFTSTTTTLLLLILALSLFLYSRRRRTPSHGHATGQLTTFKRPLPVPDGPIVLPVVGSLLSMAGAQDQPFERFARLARIYGPIYSMRMGTTPCVVVNDYPSIRDVLITNGSKFGGRPNFYRYDVLFGGDRNNCE